MTTTDSPSAIDRRSRTILGIDDSREIQTLLHAIVSSAGYSYTGASGAEEALSKIVANNAFNVILLDIEMPMIDGFSLCARIREHPKGRTVPIVFLTFHNTLQDIEKCKAAGGNAFIVKPFTGKVLLQHLDYWSSRMVPIRASA